MERFTPLYAIAYAITNSMENLRFDKEGYFHVLVFYTGCFIKEIENIFSRVPIHYRNTRGSLGELEIAWKHSPYRLWVRVPTSISRSLKLLLVLL